MSRLKLKIIVACFCVFFPFYLWADNSVALMDITTAVVKSEQGTARVVLRSASSIGNVPGGAFYLAAGSTYYIDTYKTERSSSAAFSIGYRLSVNVNGQTTVVGSENELNVSRTLGPFQSDSGFTVSAELVRIDFWAGNSSEGSFAVPVRSDTTPPVLEGIGNLNTSSHTVVLNPIAKDPESGIVASSIAFSVNGQAVSNPTTLTTQGTYSESYAATNGVGRQASQAATIIIDWTLPTVVLSKSPSSATNGDVIVTATVSDANSGIKSATYSIDSGASQSLTLSNGVGTIRVQGQTDHIVTVTAVDQCANTATGTIEVKNIDTLGPVLTLTPSTSDWTVSPVTVTASAVDARSGVNTASYSYTAGDGQAGSGQSVTISKEGDVLVSFSVRDLAGNATTSSLHVQKIDYTGPGLSLLRVPESHGGKTVTVTASAVDGGVGLDSGSLESSIDGQPFATVNPVVLTTEGNHTVIFRAKDLLGNSSIKILVVGDVDLTPPSLTLGLSSSAWSNAPLVVSAVATDAISGIDQGSLQHRLNGGSWVLGDSVSVDQEGMNEVDFKVLDLAGNLATASINVTKFDATPPVLVLEQDHSAGWTNMPIHVDAKATDLLAGVDEESYEHRVDGGAWISGSSLELALEGEHLVAFRVRDLAGNQRQESITVANYDKTPPSVTVARTPNQDWSASGYKFSASFADLASGIAEGSAAYRINGGEWQSYLGGEVSIMASGVYAVEFRVYDTAGNVATSTARGTVDATPPAVQALSLVSRSNGTPVDYASGFQRINSFDATISAADTFVDGATTKTGLVSAYYFAYSKDPSFDFEAAKNSSPTGSFSLLGLADGVWFIKLQVQDAAGNLSPVDTRILKVDLSLPAEPGIKSTTHRLSTSSLISDSATTAVFTVTNHASNLSGAPSIAYSLYDLDLGGDPLQGSATFSGEGSLTLLFSEAVIGHDSVKGYRLEVTAISGSGVQGPPAQYLFRVDTKPPSGLVLRVNPQISEDSWYPNVYAGVQWAKPTDLSGIRNCYYRLSLSDDELPTESVAAKAYDLASWSTVPGLELSLNLQAYLASIPGLSSDRLMSGALWVEVCAEDFAGNKAFAKKRINYDFGSPMIASLPGQTASMSLAVLGGQLRVAWGDVSDTPQSGSSGVSRISISTGTAQLSKIDKDDPNSLYSLNPDYGGPGVVFFGQEALDTKSWTLPVQVEDGVLYVAKVSVFDTAGNSTDYRAIVYGNGTIPENVAPTVISDYEQVLGGFTVKGQVERGEGFVDYRTANISIPSILSILNLPLGESLECAKPSDFSEQGLSKVSLLASAHNALTMAPWSFKDVQSYALSDSAGFELLGSILIFADADKVARELHFPSLSLGSLSSLGVSADPAPLDEPLDILAGGTDGSLWGLRGRKALYAGFQSNVLRFTGGSDFGIEAPDLGITIAEYTGDVESTRIRLQDLRVDSTGSLVGALLESKGDSTFSNGQVLTLGKNLYLLHAAEFKLDETGAHRLYVYDSELKLPAGASTPTTRVKDFSVDVRTGKIFLGQSYSIAGFTLLGEDGTLFSPDLTPGRIGFIDGTMVLAGTVSWPGGIDLGVSGLRLADGADSWSSTNATPFSTSLKGYILDIKSSRKLSTGLMVDEGLIHLGPSVADAQVDRTAVVKGIVLSFAGNTTALEAGATTSQTSEIEFSTAYGSIRLTDLTIDGSGVRGSFLVPSPVAFFQTTGLVFPDIPVSPLGVLGSCPALELSQELSIGGYSLKARAAVFTGASVDIGVATSSATPGFFAPLSFLGLSFSSSGMLSPGTMSGPVAYTAGGWQLEARNLVVSNSQGIAFQAAYSHSDGVSETGLGFSASTAFVDGHFVSGPAAVGSFARIAEWEIDVSGASLVLSQDGNYILSASAAHAVLPVKDGVSSIDLGGLKFDSTGAVTDGRVSLATATIPTSDGYLLSSVQKNLTGAGLWAEADLSSNLLTNPAALPFRNQSIRLYPDGTISSAEVAGPFTYSYAGWTITGSSWSIGTDSVVNISHNTVTYNGQSIQLGSLSFLPDGSLAKPGRFSLPASNRLINEYLECYEGIVDEDGIAVRAMARLPSSLGGVEVFFNRVKLLPGGGYIPNASREALDFNVGSLSFHLKSVSLDDGGFTLGSASIDLPASTASDASSFKIYGLHIGFNGTFSLSGVDPFSFLGATFALSGISLANDVLGFSGAVTLPESMPGDLAGKTFSISDFAMNVSSGEVSQFDARYEDEVSFPITEGWSVSATGIGVKLLAGEVFVGMDTGSINLPSSLGGGTATVSDLTVSLSSGQVTFGTISLTGSLPVTAFGIEFEMDKLVINSNFEVTFGGSATIGPDFSVPALRNLIIKVDSFQIHSDGSFGDIAASATLGADGELFQDVALQKGAKLTFNNLSGHAVLSCEASIAFGSSYPGLGGKVLSLKDTSFDLTDGVVKTFNLAANKMDLTLFDSVEAKDVSIGVSYTGDIATSAFSVSGKLVLPQSLPDGLKGQVVDISLFKISFAGDVSLSATYAMAAGTNLTFFDSITATGITVSASYKDSAFYFGLGGTFTLSDKFPDGLKGTVLAINTLKFDGSGNLLDVNAVASLSPGASILGSFTVQNASLGITKASTSDVQVTVNGSLALPSTLPEGLAGTVVGISNFVVDSSGAVKNGFSLSASNISASVFGCANLSGTSFSVTKSGENDYAIAGGGTLTLSNAGLPSGLQGLALTASFTASTSVGLKTFTASVGGIKEFEVFGGIKAKFSNIGITQTAISFAASVTLPSSYPEGLANTQIALSELTVGWDGTVKSISGGLGYMSFKLAGFDTTIQGLMLTLSGVSLTSCQIKMPSNFGSMAGQSVGVTNATFNKDTGVFQGAISVPSITTQVAGFNLVFATPNIDVNNRKISFASVSLTGPDFLKSMNLKLNGVAIQGAIGSTPASLTFSGGKFAIPDFTIAGGLGFKGVYVDFTVNASSFSIEGAGSAIVPGAGTFSALVSFTDRSSVYPIGLKRAYFEYTISGLGVPLGATGLYLNSIRGGIAFGPPTAAEIPNANLRAMFQSGMRIQIGVTMTDQSGGAVIQGSPTFWIDIQDWDWAFQGNITILKGKFNMSASIAAALTRYGFYAGLDVSIVFVRGHVEVYVFSSTTKQMMLVGSGYVQFCVPKGSALTTEAKRIWFVTIPAIYIPSSDWWAPAIKAEFGNFSNGQTGFKGFMDLPVVGQVGLYVGSGGGITVGSVSGISLVAVPSATKSTIPTRRGVSPSDGVIARDQMAVGESRASYRFTVPAKDGATMARGLGSRDVTSPEGSTSSTERVIFALAYLEGDPNLTVVSPSGIRYAMGDPAVEYEYVENGIVLSVLTKEVGAWTLELGNLPADAAYTIEAFSKKKAPTIVMDTPALVGESVGEAYVVTGRSSETSGTAYFSVGQKADGSDAVSLGSAAIQPDGSYSARLELSTLGDGEYFVRANLPFDAENPSTTAVAPGTIRIDRAAKAMVAVSDLIVGENDESSVRLSFSDPNPTGLVKGYNVSTQAGTDAEPSSVFVGNLSNLVIPGLPSGVPLVFTVKPVDENNREGPAASVSYALGGAKQVYNVPRFPESTCVAAAVVGETVKGSISAVVDAPVTRGDAYDYGAVVLKTPVEGVALSFDSSVIDLRGGKATLSYTIGAGLALAPGTYSLGCELYNRGNPDESASFTISLTVAYPPPVIASLRPDAWNSKDDQTLSVLGTGFLPGTRVLVNGAEVAILSQSLVAIDARVPAGIAPGQTTVTVVGPGGQSASAVAKVSAPSYTLNLYSTIAAVAPGEKATYEFSVEGIDGFTGPARLVVDSFPAGWSVDATAQLYADTHGQVIVAVPVSAALGEYRVTAATDDGKSMTFLVNVEGSPVPTISSLSTNAAYTGQSLDIYGYGFGSQGTLSLGGQPVAVSTWTENHLVAIIPDLAQSGDLVVSSGGRTSAGYPFTIRARGFTLKPGKSSLDLQPGESTSFTVVVSGYSDIAYLSCEGLEDLGTVAISPDSLVPNGIATVKISVYDTAKTMSRTLTIRGTSKDFSTSVTIGTRIGSAFEISTSSLPPGMTDSAYSATLGTINALGAVTWTMDSGELPLGVSLASSGVLSGKPVQKGSWTFSLKAVDGSNHSATKEFTVAVEENAWSQKAKDGGHSSYNPVAAPADSRRLWTTSALPGATDMLTGDGKVFVRSPSQIKAFSLVSGTILYTLEVPAQDWAYSNGILFVVTGGEGSGLVALDSSSGNALWSRLDIARFTTDGATILAWDGSALSSLDAADGHLRWRRAEALPPTAAQLFWQRGLAYEALGSHLYAIGDSGRVEVAETRAGTMTLGGDYVSIVADAEGMAYTTTYGDLVVLGRDWTVLGNSKVEAGTSLALTSASVILTGSFGVKELERTSLAPLYEAPASGSLAVAAEKLAVSSQGGLTVLNRYSGSPIWTEAGPRQALAISGERIYSLLSNGSVACYNGPDNLAPPTTTLNPIPAEPDGQGGYYRTKPLVSLSATDKETYVQSTLASLDGGEMASYSAPIAIPEGFHTLSAYSIDSKGYREATTSLNFKVDSIIPLCVEVDTATANSLGWVNAPINVTLSASDSGSGIQSITYEVDGQASIYGGAFSIATEGAHSLAWRATDWAGNSSASGSKTFLVDLYPPTVSMGFKADQGLAVVTLQGRDTGSGLAFIEYRLDGAAATSYSQPLVVQGAGSHSLAYRAWDNAGLVGDWVTASLTVPSATNSGAIALLAYSTTRLGRAVVEDIHEGDRIYGNLEDRGNRFSRLPRYLRSAEYLRPAYDDRLDSGNPYATFYLRSAAAVYLVKHPLATTDMTGWTLVETLDRPGLGRFFPAGTKVYERTFSAKSEVAIPAMGGTATSYANLVFVKPLVAPPLRIDLRADGIWAYGGREPWRFDDDMALDSAMGSFAAHWRETSQTFPALTAIDLDVDIGKPGRARDENIQAWTAVWTTSFEPGASTVSPEGYVLPYVADSLTGSFTVTLRMPDGYEVTHASQNIVVKNYANFSLLAPREGSKLRAGLRTYLYWDARDASGAWIDDDEIAWFASRDGSAWTKLAFLRDGSIRVPDTLGIYYLKAVWPEADGHSRENKFKFTVTK